MAMWQETETVALLTTFQMASIIDTGLWTDIAWWRQQTGGESQNDYEMKIETNNPSRARG